MANLPYFQVEVGSEQQRFEMPEQESEVVVGRATDCRWVIPSGGVSRRHARLIRHGREVTIEDLGSANGTFVNGERLSAPRELRDQDRVQLGAVEIRFVNPAGEPAADETIAVSALPGIAPVNPPPAAPPAETKATDRRREETATRDLPPPPPAPVEELAPEPRGIVPPPEAPPPLERSAASSPAPVAAPSGARSERSGVFLAADGSQPTIAELAIIAAGSFLLVFVIGALLIRFVF